MNDLRWTEPSWTDESIRFDPITMHRIEATPRPPEPVADTKETHLARLLDKAAVELSGKYLRGQAEHGGVLSRKPGLLQHSKEEALDLIAYLYSREEQELEALDLLRFGLSRHDWGSVKLAYNVLIYGNREGE